MRNTLPGGFFYSSLSLIRYFCVGFNWSFREILSITGITIKGNVGPGKGARFEILIPWGTFRSGSDTFLHG